MKKNKKNHLIKKSIALLAVTVVLSLVFIPQAGSQFFPLLPPPPPSLLALQPLFAPFPLRTQAIPLANVVTPLTVTVPQVTTAAGLTITSLVPGLAVPATPTLSVIVNVTAATFPLLPTTFVTPFPLTAIRPTHPQSHLPGRVPSAVTPIGPSLLFKRNQPTS